MSRDRRLLILSTTVLLIALHTPTAPAREAPTSTVPVGVAQLEITPETPVRMYGYAARKTESEAIAGRLHAKALAIGEDERLAVLLTVDCGAVPRALRDEVYRRVNRETPIAPERFVLCNSHNHSGPNLKGMDAIEGDQHARLVQYAEQLTDRLVRVVQQAVGSRVPARLAVAQGEVGFASNRRVLTDGQWTGFGAVPEAPADHSLSVLKATDVDGQLLALLSNYACHNTTLRGDFKEIHGDWAACAQEAIEANHPGTTALISIGCGADSDPCPHGTVDLCQQHGRALADQVQRLVAGPWTPISPQLTAQRSVLEIPWAKSPDMEKAKEAAERSYPVKQAVERIEQGEKLPETAAFQISTWTFGDDLAMVFFSDEVVVDYALRLKRELDAKRLWITAYADDVSRYIVSERLIGEGGYEVRNSLSATVTFGQPAQLDPPMEERIITRVKAMLPETFHAEPASSSAGAGTQTSLRR